MKTVILMVAFALVGVGATLAAPTASADVECTSSIDGACAWACDWRQHPVDCWREAREQLLG